VRHVYNNLLLSVAISRKERESVRERPQIRCQKVTKFKVNYSQSADWCIMGFKPNQATSTYNTKKTKYKKLNTYTQLNITKLTPGLG